MEKQNEQKYNTTNTWNDGKENDPPLFNARDPQKSSISQQKTPQAGGPYANLFALLIGLILGAISSIFFSTASWSENKSSFAKGKSGSAQDRQIQEEERKYDSEDQDIDVLNCPITSERMNDPVVGKCGHSFERESILSWLKKNSTCPLCSRRMQSEDLTTNYALKNVSQSWRY